MFLALRRVLVLYKWLSFASPDKHTPKLDFVAKERPAGRANEHRSFAYCFFSLFSSVNEYSLLSRLKCMLLATLTTAEVFVFLLVKRE